MFAHRSESAAENSAQRAIGKPQCVFDGAIVHLFEVTQGQRGAMNFRQGRERRMQALIDRRRISCFQLVCFDCFAGERNSSAFTKNVVCSVSRDRCQPGRKFIRVAHAPPRLPSLNEGILYYVFGRSPIPRSVRTMLVAGALGIYVVIAALAVVIGGS